MMTWATPISGSPEAKYRIEAQSPSTRKIGMPTASRPKNSTRNRMISMTGSPAPSVCFRPRRTRAGDLLMRGDVADRHALGIEGKDVAIEPDQITAGHQRSPGRHRRRIKTHRKLHVRRTALVQHPRRLDDAEAVPGKARAERQSDEAIGDLHPALDAWRNRPQHQIGPHMAVGAHQLRGS